MIGNCTSVGESQDDEERSDDLFYFIFCNYDQTTAQQFGVGETKKSTNLNFGKHWPEHTRKGVVGTPRPDK